MSIYKTNPVLENEKFLLRLTESKDCDDLLKVCRILKMNYTD